MAEKKPNMEFLKHPSFTQLDDGSFGVRMPKDSEAKEGDKVTVVKKNGEKSQVVLGEHAGENKYGDPLFRKA